MIAFTEAVIHANKISKGQAPFTSNYSGTGDDRIHYVEAGQGPVVMFVHGFPSFWYCWRAQMEYLRSNWRVIAIDAPGGGLSAKPDDTAAYRVERLAERLDRLIQELAPGQKINLVGHDWGGALAWSYAKWNSARLHRLAVFSAPPFDLILELLATDAEQRALSDYMLRLRVLDGETIERENLPAVLYELAYGKAVENGALTPAEGELFREALALPGALHGGTQWYAANIPPFSAIDLERDAWPAPRLEARVPTLLVEGSEDRTFVRRLAEAARGHATSLEVVTLDGVGHWTPFERPDLTNATLKRFLESS